MGLVRIWGFPLSNRCDNIMKVNTYVRLFQNMNDEKRQKLDCATAILNHGKDFSAIMSPEEVRERLLTEIKNNLRDLHLKSEEGRNWLARKQLSANSPGIKGKVVFSEVGSTKSDLCVCSDTSECDIQMSDFKGNAFLLWQQQKGEMVKEKAGWVIVQFDPEVSKKDMIMSFSLIWDFLKILARGDGQEATDWRMVASMCNTLRISQSKKALQMLALIITRRRMVPISICGLMKLEEKLFVPHGTLDLNMTSYTSHMIELTTCNI